MITIAFLLFVAGGVSAQRCNQPLYSVPDFNVANYIDGWYEIGTSRAVYGSFERTCVCVKANYTLVENEFVPYVTVNNQCRRRSVTAPIEVIEGQATQENPRAPGELTVSFGPTPPSGPNYFVMEVGPRDNYGPSNPNAYALIGEPCRRALWILSRNPYIDDQLYNSLLAIAVSYGFNPEEIGFRKTLQDLCW